MDRASPKCSRRLAVVRAHMVGRSTLLCVLAGQHMLACGSSTLPEIDITPGRLEKQSGHMVHGRSRARRPRQLLP